MNTAYQRSFLKWPGGKFNVLPHILRHVPKKLSCWVEPFVGAGTVFLNVTAKEYWLADVNPDLINVYVQLQQQGHVFVERVKKLFQPRYNTAEAYQRWRERFNHASDQAERARLFIYLNRHGFNGLCRYNRSGRFNVPFGRYVKPLFPEAALHAFYVKAKTATFVCEDFQQTFARDFPAESMIYADPPYVPLTASSAFTQYAQWPFQEQAQVALAHLAQHKARTGVPVLLSNHHTPQTRVWYEDAELSFFPVRRSIAAQQKGRGHVEELLAFFAGSTVDKSLVRRARRARVAVALK